MVPPFEQVDLVCTGSGSYVPLAGQTTRSRMYEVGLQSSVSPGSSVLVFFISSAQVALAPSICLRLAMQALR